MATDCEPSCVAYNFKKEPNNQLRIPAPENGGIEIQRLQADSLYGSLDPLETWQIRILELQPRSEQSGLVGRLFNAAMLDGGGIVDLETKTWRDFFAISYFWGEDQRPRFRLDCNDLPYLLPIEAYRALIRVRDEALPVYLWIDTVCINQHDVQEKSVQVAKMRSIYHSAAWVLAYLGEPQACADDSSLDGEAVDFVFGLLNDYEDFHRLKPSEQAAGGCTVTERLEGCGNGEWPFCDRHATLLERGVHVLSERNWFDRIWIKQETWAARALGLRLGVSVTAWRTLGLLGDCLTFLSSFAMPSDYKARLHTSGEKLLNKLDGLTIGTRLALATADSDDQPNPRLQQDKSQDIVNLLQKAVDAKSSCTHDRIYALLGMSSVNVQRPVERRTNCFTISYTEHPATTFTRLARYIIYRDESLDILLLDSAFPRPEHAGEVDGKMLPSWVPDWRRPFSACQRYSILPEGWQTVRWQQESRQSSLETLCLQGCILGTIQYPEALGSRTEAPICWTHPELRSHGRRETYAYLWDTVLHGDLVALIPGLHAPALLRATGVPKTYQYLGHINPWSEYLRRNSFFDTVEWFSLRAKDLAYKVEPITLV